MLVLLPQIPHSQVSQPLLGPAFLGSRFWAAVAIGCVCLGKEGARKVLCLLFGSCLLTALYSVQRRRSLCAQLMHARKISVLTWCVYKYQLSRASSYMNMLGDFPTATGLSLLHLPSLPNGFGSKVLWLSPGKEILLLGLVAPNKKLRRSFRPKFLQGKMVQVPLFETCKGISPLER